MRKTQHLKGILSQECNRLVSVMALIVFTRSAPHTIFNSLLKVKFSASPVYCCIFRSESKRMLFVRTPDAALYRETPGEETQHHSSLAARRD